MGRLVKVGEVGDLSPGEGKVVDAGGKEVALFNVGGTLYAIGNSCAHRGGPLAEGKVNGTTVTCNWHGWTFDLPSGISPLNPVAKVPSYRVDMQGKDIFVELP
jgi:nitrite reductase (NADH) small subunit